MSDPAKPPSESQDPSMEDILASIRRLLSEEDRPATGTAEAVPDVVALTPGMLVREGRSVLVAPEAAAASTGAVQALLRAIAAREPVGVHRGGPTIEEAVREELRPMVKAWLDANLPALVERLVRVEIERVVGRALP